MRFPLTGRKLLRFGALLVAVTVTVSVIAGLVLSHYLSDGKRLARWLEAKLGAALVGGFTVTDARYGFPNGLVIRGFVARTPSGSEVLHVDSVSGNVMLTRLLGGTIGIDDIRVDGVRLVLANDGGNDAKMGLVSAFSPRPSSDSDPSESGWVVDAAIDYVHDANVTLAVSEQNVQLANLSLGSSRVRVDGSAVGVETAGITARVQAVFVDLSLAAQVEIGSLSLALADETTRVAARDIVIESEGSRVAGGFELHTTGVWASTRLQGDVTTMIRDDHSLVVALMASHWRGPPVAGELRARVAGAFVGATGSIQVELDVEPDRLRFANMPVGVCRLQLRGQGSSLTLTTSRVELGDGVLTASGVLGLAGDRISHDFEVTLERLPLRRLLGDAPATVPELVSGQLSATGVDLRELNTRVTAELTFPGYTLVASSQPQTPRLSLSGDVLGSRILEATVGWREGPLEVNVRGSIDLGPGGLCALDVDAVHGNPGLVLRQLASEVSANEARFRGRAEGEWENPDVVGTASVRGLRALAIGPMDLVLPVTLTDRLLSIRRGALATPGGTVALDGTWHLSDGTGWSRDGDISATLAGEGVALVNLVPGDEAKVTVGFSARVSGRLAAPLLTLQLHATDGSFRGIEVTDLRLDANTDLSTATVSALDLRLAGGGVVQAHGNVQIDGSAVDGHVRVDDMPIGAVGALVGSGRDASGVARLRGDMTGSLTQPRIVAELRITDAAWRQVGLGVADLRVDGDLASASASGSVVGLLGRAEVSGSIQWQTQAANVRLVLNLTDVGRLTRIVRPDLTTAGQANIDFTFSGPILTPEVHGRVELLNGMLAGRNLGRFEADLTTLSVPNGTSYELHGGFVDGPALIAGTARFTPAPLTLDLAATFEALSTQGLVANLDKAGVRAVASGSGSLRWSPETTLDVEVRLQEMTVSLPADEMRLERPATVRLALGGIAVDDLRLVGAHTHLSVRGVVGDTIDLTAEGTTNVALAAFLVPAVTHASGTVALKLEAVGSAAEPRLRGFVRPQNPLSVRLRGVREEIVLEKGQLSFASEALVIEGVEARFGDGRIVAHGRVGLVKMRPSGYKLDVGFDGLVLNTGELTFEADGALSLGGTGPVPAVRGRLDIVRGRYHREFELHNLAFVAKPTPPAKAPSAPPEWLHELQLDLDVASAEPFEVDVRAGPLRVQALMDAHLQVRGNAAAVIVEGRISGESGSIRFPAAELELVETTIDFEPSADLLEAAIHVRAEGEITPRGQPETYLTDLRLDGDPNRLALEVNTDPALDRVEALLLLATGTLTSARSAPGSNGAELDAALTVASGQLASPLTAALSDQIEKLFNFRPELGVATSSTVLEVGVSQRITDRLRLEGTYRRAYDGSLALTTARARMLFSDRLFVEGTARALSASDESDATGLGSQNQVELKYRLMGK